LAVDLDLAADDDDASRSSEGTASTDGSADGRDGMLLLPDPAFVIKTRRTDLAGLASASTSASVDSPNLNNLNPNPRSPTSPSSPSGGSGGSAGGKIFINVCSFEGLATGGRDAIKSFLGSAVEEVTDPKTRQTYSIASVLLSPVLLHTMTEAELCTNVLTFCRRVYSEYISEEYR
jgi:hypothetical protein